MIRESLFRAHPEAIEAFLNRISKLLTSKTHSPYTDPASPGSFFYGMDVAPAWMKEEPLTNAEKEGIVLHLMTYRAWLAIRRRHLNGGVAVCERWDHFECFLADMGTRPRGTRLVRIDKDSAYGPNNCLWRSNKRQRDARGLATLTEHVQWIKELYAAGHTEHEIAGLLRTTRAAVRDALGTPAI